MRAVLVVLGLSLASSSVLSQSEARLRALEEERAEADEVTRQLQALDVLGPKIEMQAAAGMRKGEVIIPNVSIYCGTANCNAVAAKLCADLGYKASRPLRPKAQSSGVICSDPGG